jgi:hypothetical protein
MEIYAAPTSARKRLKRLSIAESMPPGSVISAELKPQNGTTNFAWFIWLRDYDGAPEIKWLRRDGGML